MSAERDCILIADAGGTSTAWGVVRPEHCGGSYSFRAMAINAALMPHEDIAAALAPVRKELGGARVAEIRFFGAGCATSEISESTARILASAFGTDLSRISVRSDLYGAALALWGDEPGIACISGTGSASCMWNGREIADAVPSLGYVLGDEGSGAHLGKLLLNAYFKRRLPEHLQKALKEEFPQLTLGAALHAVYREKGANGWLASFAPFLSHHSQDPYIADMAGKSYREFCDSNLAYFRSRYPECRNVAFAGSLASVFSGILGKAVAEAGFELKKTAADPIDSLIRYYSRNL